MVCLVLPSTSQRRRPLLSTTSTTSVYGIRSPLPLLNGLISSSTAIWRVTTCSASTLLSRVLVVRSWLHLLLVSVRTAAAPSRFRQVILLQTIGLRSSSSAYLISCLLELSSNSPSTTRQALREAPTRSVMLSLVSTSTMLAPVLPLPPQNGRPTPTKEPFLHSVMVALATDSTRSSRPSHSTWPRTVLLLSSSSTT